MLKKKNKTKHRFQSTWKLIFFLNLPVELNFRKTDRKKKSLGNAIGETSSGTTERMTNQIKSFVSLSYVSSSVFFLLSLTPAAFFEGLPLLLPCRLPLPIGQGEG